MGLSMLHHEAQITTSPKQIVRVRVCVCVCVCARRARSMRANVREERRHEFGGQNC